MAFAGVNHDGAAPTGANHEPVGVANRALRDFEPSPCRRALGFA